jgi:hypothetical protein
MIRLLRAMLARRRLERMTAARRESFMLCGNMPSGGRLR